MPTPRGYWPVTREQSERNRQAIIRSLMVATGLTYEQAEAQESERFCRAVSRLLRADAPRPHCYIKSL